MIVKPASKLTLHDRLSRLTLPQAKKLLGPEGAPLLGKGGAIEIDINEQVLNTGEVFQVTFPRPGETGPVVVTISLHDFYRDRLQIACSHSGEKGTLYKAATLALILEEKTVLGFATDPVADMPWELMNETKLEFRALAERELRAREEKMTVRATNANGPWTDYTVMSALSGKTYRVALRGMARGQSFCNCPDFRKNRLGTCKHVLKVAARAQEKFPASAFERPWKPGCFAIHVRYDGDTRLGLEIPDRASAGAAALAEPWWNRFAASEAECVELFHTVQMLERAGEGVVIYPDAEERLNLALHQHRMSGLVSAIRKNPGAHPLRTQLLKTHLLPYQLDGAAFAAGAGRAVLADDMGLGKTIQGVAVAELLARECGVQRVLIVCPASLKAQWRVEVQRFSDRTVQLVGGKISERTEQYATGAFFTVCNYEQVLRDYLDIERCRWDLIMLDEAQRIKNWEAKTSRVIKSLRSRYALVLTGTPLENRLDDLYSVLEFIDARRLGPAYRFIHQHRVTDEDGKVLGYKKLDALRQLIAPVLLRRTRQSVALDLPPRTSEIVRITPTDEQGTMHDAHMRIVATIVRKSYISEMDLLRLQKALLMARMSANSTFLVDKEAPGYSSKLQRLTELLESLIAEPARKIIVFSEWTTTLDLIEPVLDRLKAGRVRLDGSVPQKKRQQIVAEFQNSAACRVFLTTNAGSTGLNLQAADTVINVDLPWNPALLEQRIARAHRMGQKRPVHVFLLITEGTIEEGLLATLSAKHELAAAVLDPDSNLSEVSLVSGMDALKRRLELLLGAKPAAAPDVSVEQRAAAEAQALAGRQARAQEAGGHMLTAALTFVAELLPSSAPAPETAAVTALKSGLEQCMTQSPDGAVQLNFTLPGKGALDALATALARLMAVASPGNGGNVQ